MRPIRRLKTPNRDLGNTNPVIINRIKKIRSLFVLCFSSIKYIPKAIRIQMFSPAAVTAVVAILLALRLSKSPKTICIIISDVILVMFGSMVKNLPRIVPPESTIPAHIHAQRQRRRISLDRMTETERRKRR